MSYTLFEMAINPDIQKKVQKEIDEALKSSNGEITEEVINKLTFLEQCLMETVRVHCPVFQLSKISLKETEFPPQYENSTKTLKLAEETNVVIPVYALHL
jgi:cytochrome P450 family 6